MQDTQKFLDAEKSAEALVKALAALQQEAGSYNTATRALEEVRQKLVELIQTTQEIAKLALESVSVLKSIGGPEILNRVTALTEKLELYEKASQTYRGTLKTLVISLLAMSAISLVLVVIHLAR